MGENYKILIFSFTLFLFVFLKVAKSQSDKVDLLRGDSVFLENNILIPDSIQEVKSAQKKISQYYYRFLFSPSKKESEKKEPALDYYKQMQGKVISKIEITALDVFGPTFNDTTKKAKSWIEKTANTIHTKSNLNTIQKLLMFNTGDTVNSELFYENERIIRMLPYISDVKFNIEPDSLNPESVNVRVITKDRFSFGVSGGVNGTSSADLEIYNQNIFGVGHEISFRFVGHVQRQPYMGLETFYNINNIKGKFINISAGYMDTYQREGFSFNVSKPFITPSMKWGYGSSALRMYRTNNISENDPVKTEKPFDVKFLSAWGGRSFQINKNEFNSSQIILSAAIYNQTFVQRPDIFLSGNEYFSNRTFYLAGITFTQRKFVQDQLIYSYGITEDIPKGYKNEFVYGYDANEFGDRHYFHLYLSNGNFLINRDGYLYMNGGIGGYFRNNKFTQGQIQGGINYISRQINAGKKTFRLFFKSNYLLGISRYEVENLSLSLHDDIRGFASSKAIGKQKLSADLEYVLFLKKEILKFNLAFFGFADVGIIGTNKKIIFTQNYYSGVGFGMRLHNENLVFKTFQLRFAFYPFHPDDMSFTGFILNEQLKNSFYSFEPKAPQPLIFQ